jgi:hypothetical protein
MSSNMNEQDWMAYLYGELEGEEKARVEQHILENPEAREAFEKFQRMRGLLSTVEDKEVIAPPIFVGKSKQRFLWNAPYFKTIVSIAASLLLVILVGKLTGTKISYSNSELRLSFGGSQVENTTDPSSKNALTTAEVQQMINQSLSQNNLAVNATLKESQEKLNASIRQNLAQNSGKIDKLVRESAKASQAQISQYVSSLQSENMQVVKDYFQLTSTDQKKYIENLLVDFAQYLQQQRNNDLQVVQTQLSSLKQNTDIFKQETEQILTSIISTVNNSTEGKETNN